MNLRQLEALVAVAKTGSFTSAAKLLYLSQPAISRAIISLERELGQRLVLRVGDHIAFTDVGQEVLLAARRITTEVARVQDSVRHTVTQTEILRVVCTTMGLRYIYGPFLTDFRLHHPTIGLWLHSVSSPEEGLQQLLHGLTDAAFHPLPLAPEHNNRLRSIMLGEVEHVLVRAPGHEDMVMSARTIPFVLFEPGTGTRRYFDQHLLPVIGNRMDVRAESNDVDFVRELVVHGIGMALLPLSVVSEELGRGQMERLSLPSGRITEAYGVAVHRNDLVPAAEQLARFASQVERDDQRCAAGSER